MKPSLVLAAVLCLPSPFAMAQAGADAELAKLLPGERAVETIAPDEKNPFGQRAAVQTAGNFGVDTEESRIRGYLASLPIGGISGAAGSYRVLIGAMRLSEGEEVPSILPTQAERLRVTKLTDHIIEFSFVEQDGKTGERTFSRAISMKPEVRFMLPSQVPVSGGGGRGIFGGAYRDDEGD